ncbi:hypothetical protein E3P92_03204 [Wallemia ichthyophaga]|nr:hypothetical protein E3P92_03204 [Wallemia ichthyophaga]
MLEGVVAGLLNRFLSAYIDNLDTSQLNVGIWSGDVKLKNLKLRKSALDKFRLPVDVKEGYLGELTLSIPWSNLKGKPCKINIDNVYLIALPAGASQFDAEEDDKRSQQVKQERLDSAELLLNSQASPGISPEDEKKNESFANSLVTKILNNLQLVIENIHIRYQDSISHHNQLFAVGLTLSGFSAVSTDSNWLPTFIEENREGIHKLAKLESLSAYWDTDAESLLGHPTNIAIEKFTSLIANKQNTPNHQYILKPVSGEGRLRMNHQATSDTPKLDIELLFDRIGFMLNEEQYRDALLMVDNFHFHIRQSQYIRLRPNADELHANKPRALLSFAARAILNEVHERNKKWTWAYFAERRDDRKLYVALWKERKESERLQKGMESDRETKLRRLEEKLRYEDIRFYRSIARSELRKESLRQRGADSVNPQTPQPTQQGWMGWAWNAASWAVGQDQNAVSTNDDKDNSATLNEQQRKELYDAIEWDEKQAVSSAVDLPKDAMKLRVKAILNTGSLALRYPNTSGDLVSIVFSALTADVVKRVDNLSVAVGLGDLSVKDATNPKTIYPNIVSVKRDSALEEDDKTQQFFSFAWESKPLDNRADSALQLKMRHLEIIYHKGYVEAIRNFFKPPESKLESINALIDVASESLDSFRKQTRTGFEYAIAQHSTIDLRVDMNAPIIILPQDVTDNNTMHLVLDAGHIAVESDLADKKAIKDVRHKAHAKSDYEESDWKQLEELMYDKFSLQLKRAQLLIGNDLNALLGVLERREKGGMDGKNRQRENYNIVEEINLNLTVHNSILPSAVNLTRFRVAGHLPELTINISERKYQSMMAIIDVAIPHFDDNNNNNANAHAHIPSKPTKKQTENENTHARRGSIFTSGGDLPTYDLDVHDDDGESVTGSLSEAETVDRFFEAPESVASGVSDEVNYRQQVFTLDFRVDKLQANAFRSTYDSDGKEKEKLLAEGILKGFYLGYVYRQLDMHVDVLLQSLSIVNVDTNCGTRTPLITSDDNSTQQKQHPTELVRVRYDRVQPHSPEFHTVYHGIDQIVDTDLSTINLLARPEPIIELYAFIMETFVGGRGSGSGKTDDALANANPHSSPEMVSSQLGSQLSSEDEEGGNRKIKVDFKLHSIVFKLDDGVTQLATLILSAGDVSILLDNTTMQVNAKLGGLEISDDNSAIDDGFRQLLSIEGEELADFSYQTFDPKRESYPGYNSSVYLRTASLKFTFNEEPVNDLYKFLIKFARLKALYDAATRAAQDAANDVNGGRMQYDVRVRAPIIVFPTLTNQSMLTMRLGEFVAKNSFTGKSPGDIQHLHTGLHGINLTSTIRDTDKDADKDGFETLPILDNVNLDFNFDIFDQIVLEDGKTRHGMQKIHGHMTDVKVALTQTQYVSLYDLSKSIPKAFTLDEQHGAELGEEADQISIPRDARKVVHEEKEEKVMREVRGQEEERERNGERKVAKKTSVDLNPEILLSEQDKEQDKWTSTELAFDVGTVSLELFTPLATSARKLEENSIARFSLNDTNLKLKTLSDGSMESELTLKSLRMDDTRAQSGSKFRQLIPPAIHDGHQFMIHYSKAGGTDQSSLALLTIDSPKIIFSVDPLFALTDYFYSAIPAQSNDSGAQETQESYEDPMDVDVDQLEDSPIKQPDEINSEPSFAYRLNVVNTSIIILANESEPTTEAIELSVKQVLMSQHGVIALKVDRLGMFLSRMDKPKDKLRFLDNFDFTLSYDSRKVDLRQNTSIELRADPIIFRASYRDILLITDIFNKALELSTKSRPTQVSPDELRGGENTSARSVKAPAISPGAKRYSGAESASAFGITPASQNHLALPAPSMKPKVMITKENLSAVFEGFQVVLIEDLHELPLIHLHTKRFNIDLFDWTSEMKIQTAVSWSINYFNPTNSHWEPLMDPWELTLRGERLQPPTGMNIVMSSRRRLEINLTSSFIQTALLFYSLIGNNATRLLEKPRGSSAPFLLRNHTGYDMNVWPTHDASNTLSLSNTSESPWRFEDLRTLREDVSASAHNSVGIQLDNTKWESVGRISVDKEGEQTYILKSKISKVLHRVVVDIRLQDTFKVVTFRSTYQVENSSHLPIEIVIIGGNGKPAGGVSKLTPGQSYALPIEAAYEKRIKIRPDPGFGYAWSSEAFYWQDVMKNPSRSISCKASDHAEPSFKFQACADFDPADELTRIYPRLTLRLRSPIEIENLLPYDIKFRIFDKNTKQDQSSFLLQGGVSPLHLIELSHLVLLSITIENSVFSPSEFAIINTDNPDDFPVESVLSLSDQESLKLNVRIHYYRYPKSGGAFKVQIYSPYVLYNKSGFDFVLRSKSLLGAGKNVAGQDLSSSKMKKRETSPFMFSHNSDDRQKRFLLRIGDSNWSKPLSFDVAAADTEVTLSAQGDENVHIGMSVVEGNGKYKLSKVVTIQPRFLIKSQLSETINARVDSSPYLLNLKASERKALHRLESLDEDEKHLLKISYPGTKEWSAPFSLTDVGPVHLRMRLGDQVDHLIKADVCIEGPTIFVYLKKDTDLWPFMVENNSDTGVEIWQSTTEGGFDDVGISPADKALGYDNLTMMPGLKPKRYNVAPHSSMDYAWDAPAETDKKLRLRAQGGKERSIDLMEIGALPPYRFASDTLSIDVRADGPRQVLVLSPYSQDESLYQPRRRSVAKSETSDSTAGQFEEKNLETVLNTQFSLELEGVGVSVLNRRMQELFYASFRGIGMQYSDSNLHTSYNMSCKWIQIDNQLFGGLFPIILYPTTQPKDGRELERQPTLDSSVIISKDYSHGVTRIEYFSMLLQSMTIEVDEDFLMALIDFSRFEEPSWDRDQQKEDCLIESPVEIIEPADLGSGMQLYFQVFHLQPISLDLSFMRTDRVNVDNKTTSAHTRNPVMFFINALTMALGNVSGAPIRLNSLILQNARFTSSLLSQHIMINYREQFMYQLYRVLGSADFLGNPVGLFNNVSSGVADIFYEPYQGLVMHGNKELGIGIARGATSFVKKTVFGVTDSMSKVTGSIGKGLSAITLDQEYQSRRRMAQRRNKPKHALYGVAAGANAFAVSIASGFEGLALKPIEGAQRSGTGGFFKGVGRGIVGAVTKPVIGVFDLASNVSEGIRNTTTVFDPQDIDRIRLPRFIADDGVLRAYSERESLGQSWLKNVENGKYFNETYVAHLNVRGSDAVLLLTTAHILEIQVRNLELRWEVAFDELHSISLENHGISLRLKGNVTGPFMNLTSQESRTWFFQRIQSVVNNYNYARSKPIER